MPSVVPVLNHYFLWDHRQPVLSSQPSYTASSEQAPIHFAAEKSISGTEGGQKSRAEKCPIVNRRKLAQDKKNQTFSKSAVHTVAVGTGTYFYIPF